MLTTHDSYYYAKGAKDLLEGTFIQTSNSPIYSAPSILAAFFVKILPFSFDKILFYLPIFLSSLIVIPIILLFAHLKELQAGFIAALLASVGVSYYNRTMGGYFDTDMLNITLPLLLIWSLSLAINTKKDRYILFTGLEIVFYRWWYPQSYSIEFAFFALLALFVFLKKRDSFYHFGLLSIMLIAMMGLHDLVRLFAVIALFIFFTKYKKHSKTTLFLAFILFLATGGFNPIYSKLKGYVFKNELLVSGDPIPLYFFTVMQTIKEALLIPTELIFTRISGHSLVFFYSLIGYVLLLFRYKITLLTLPMLGLGLLSYFGGLRFTIYAVPILGFGFGFLTMELNSIFKNRFHKERNIGVLSKAFVVTAVFLGLYPNINHIISYKAPTVLNHHEAKQLNELELKNDDYIISWWDYGYALSFFTGAHTLIDGGRHQGNLNFPVSYSFFASLKDSASLLKFSTYYHHLKAQTLLNEKELPKEQKSILPSSSISWLMRDFNYDNSNTLLKNLQTLPLPELKRDLYLYLPYRLTPILGTVANFSYIDLMSGNSLPKPLFHLFQNVVQDEEILVLSQNIFVDKKRALVNLGKNSYKLKTLITTSYEDEFKKQISPLHEDGELTLIYMSSYNSFLLIENKLLNSTFIKLFVLEEYDERFFKPISLKPWAKIYKIL